MKARRHRILWSKREDHFLRATYPWLETAEISAAMERSISSIYGRVGKLGIEKSGAYIAEKKRKGRERLASSGVAHRYPKGHVPANKGTRRPGWAPGRMATTQFRKGQVNGQAAQLEMPLWSFRWVDGYMMLKTGKQHGPPNTGWEYVHKLIWEQANGPLPHWREARLWWKDGDHANCSLSNLELVPAREHMARTTVHNLPAPLKQVIQLTGALKRKIRNREEKLLGKEYAAGSAGSLVRDARIAG